MSDSGWGLDGIRWDGWMEKTAMDTEGAVLSVVVCVCVQRRKIRCREEEGEERSLLLAWSERSDETPKIKTSDTGKKTQRIVSKRGKERGRRGRTTKCGEELGRGSKQI